MRRTLTKRSSRWSLNCRSCKTKFKGWRRIALKKLKQAIYMFLNALVSLDKNMTAI